MEESWFGAAAEVGDSRISAAETDFVKFVTKSGPKKTGVLSAPPAGRLAAL